MKKLILDPEFMQLFPDAEINMLIASDIDNQVNESRLSELQDMLDAGKEAGKQYISDENFSQNEVIQEWRQAFQQFKTKKGARSSIEAMLKRVYQDREFNPINPLVDIYNSVSMTYGVPVGGEDIQKIEGDMHLGMAKGGESFFPLGAEEDAPALEGEICYFDNEGAICRCFNWREAQRTMLQEETHNAVLIIEAINEKQVVRAREAIQKLKTDVDQYFGIDAKIQRLNKDNLEAIIEE